MRYFLIGLPGCGKSYWGERWAEKIKTNYFDLDSIIENNEGLSVKTIFKEEGENHFRNLETFYLKKLIDNYETFILSCGGGTPCFNENLDLINSHGKSIFINPPLIDISQRIMNNNELNKRPLFKGKDTKKVISELYNKRKDIYFRANYIIDNPDVNSIITKTT